MTDFFTDTRSSMDACSLLDEEIAAFLDGTLSPEDRERITAHLDSCESCSEIFAAVVQFQEEEGSGLGIEGDVPFPFVKKPDGKGVSPPAMVDAAPFPFAGETDRTGVSRPPMVAPEKVHPRASRWLALAASLLLVPLGYLAWRELMAPPRIVLADIAEPLEQDTSVSALLYDDQDFRGDKLATGPGFMAGVYLLDLRLGLRAEDVSRTSEILHDLSQTLKEIPYLSDNLKALALTYQDQSSKLETSSDLARFASQHSANEGNIQEELSDFEEFQFGLWTEAGHVSARKSSPAFFEDRNNRRFLSHLFEQPLWVGEESLEEVPNELQAIQQIWDAGELTVGDYTNLATHFKNIIRAFESSSEL